MDKPSLAGQKEERQCGVTDDSTAKEFCTRKQYVDSGRSATTDRLLLNASYPYEGETLEALRLGSSSVERAFPMDRWKKEKELPSRAPRAFFGAPRKGSMRTALIVASFFTAAAANDHDLD